MDSRHVSARFEAERQALAMMDHGHIARVFDAGVAEVGRIYSRWPRGTQKSEAGTTSPPARVINAARVWTLMPVLRKRTVPSANTALAPPG